MLPPPQAIIFDFIGVLLRQPDAQPDPLVAADAAIGRVVDDGLFYGSFSHFRQHYDSATTEKWPFGL